jgi:GLPGLI family protein
MENDINRGVNLAINFGGGRGILYTNLKNKIKLHQADGYGEKFLIKGKIEFKWEITQETKKIGNYNCYKAILKEKLSKKSKNTIAWFSAEIPYSFGPNGYCGLPGLILELELNNGFLFKVTDIHLKKEASKKIVKPSKGIKISEEEFLDLGKKSSENLIKN